MGEVDPIDVGARIEAGKTVGRVKNIWIDEDGNPQVSIRWTGVRFNDRPDEKVSYDDIREMMEAGEVVRTNTGHEAWKWRCSPVHE